MVGKSIGIIGGIGGFDGMAICGMAASIGGIGGFDGVPICDMLATSIGGIGGIGLVLRLSIGPMTPMVPYALRPRQYF